MDKKDFFIKKNDIVNLDIFGQVFKFKRVNSDDELNWVDEYTEKVEVIDKNTQEVKIISKQNLKKLTKCKLRNIVEVPFTREELAEISGIDKDYSKYTDEDKDSLFGMLNPTILNTLIGKIDGSKHKKKSSFQKS